MKEGYKKTSLGEIPVDWEVVKIEELGKIVSGGTPKTNVKSYWNGNISWLTPTDVTALKGAKFIAKTTKQIYFIPVKIKGTMKLHLKVNPKVKVEKFPLDQSTTEVIKESSKDIISSFVIQFNSNNKKIHQIEFWGVLKQWL